MIYLDANSTTRPTERVRAAMARADEHLWANPSSVHRAGQEVRREIELARDRVCTLIAGSKPREIVFTSGGTEALDLAIRGSIAARASTVPTLITTAVEHAAIRDLGEELSKRGLVNRELLALRSDTSGIVDEHAAAETIARAGRNSIIVMQWANNETGAIQPVGTVGLAARAAGATFICDATQWVGKRPTFVREPAPREPTPTEPGHDDDLCPCDALICAPHKFHGPKGVGILWLAPTMRLRPTLLGSQEMGRRGGTENTSAIIGAGVACEEAAAWLNHPARPSPRDHFAAMRDRFEAQLLASIPWAKVHSEARLWNTSSIAFPGLEAEALLLALSERGLYASAGAACSSGSLEPSPVLLAMGINEPEAHGTLRFSLSRETTEAELTQAVPIIAEVVRRLAKIM
jgi:cysteine desulfurase